MELTVHSGDEAQTLRCSYDGDRLVANGDWNISINTNEMSFSEISDDENVDAEEQFMDTVRTLERVVDIGSNDHLRNLVMIARNCFQFGMDNELDEYVAILLQLCQKEERHSLRDCVFGALLEVIEFQEQEFAISGVATSELITCIFEFIQVTNNDIDTTRVCLEILNNLAVDRAEYFVPQGRILVIFDILNRQDTSEISEYVLNLVKVLLRQRSLNNFLYFEHALPSLEKSLQSSDEITQITAARLYNELAMIFEDYSEFIRKLCSQDIVAKFLYLLANTKDLQYTTDLFGEILSYLAIACVKSHDWNTYCLISRTIFLVLTGNKELPNGEFEFVFNQEDFGSVTYLVVELLRPLSAYIEETNFYAITDEYVTKIREAITCLFRISQEIFLSPSCGLVSKLWCLESFQFIIDCRWYTKDFDKLFLPYLKCNEVVQRLMETLLDSNIHIVATSVSAIDLMLRKIPYIVAKPFSMFGLYFALESCMSKYQYLMKKSWNNVVSKTRGYFYYHQTDEEKELTDKMEILVERLKMVKSRFGNLTVEDIDQHPTILDNLHAAVKSLSEQKELHLIRMAIEDDKITPYIVLETKLIPSLLYFLIGVDNIVAALNLHHSELNLRIGDNEKIIRNNNIKKFLNLFLGCETDGSCPPRANNKKPFIKLINILQSALPIDGCLNLHTEFGKSKAEVQELLLYNKGNRRPSRDLTGPDNMLESYLIPHFDKPYVIDDPSSEIISLLNVLYGINEHYGDLYPPGSFNPPLSQEQFVNNYITETLGKFTSRAPLVNNSFNRIIPLHMWKILFSCPFLVELNRRLIIFRKLLQHWDCNVNIFRTEASEVEHRFASKVVFSVSRNNIIEESEQYFTSSHVLSRDLEVNFKGEMGTGDGPTQEFYTVISKEIQNTKFNLWRGDTSLTDQLDADGSTPDYIVTSNGLYPKPISGRSSTENNEVAPKFELLGKIMAKALLVGKVIDLNMNECFFNLFLRREHCMGMNELYKLDPEIGKTLSYLKSLLNESQKSEDVTNVLPSHLQHNDFKADLGSCSIDELCLDFTLPGYPDIDLQKDGRNTDVNMNNLHKYIRLVIQWTLQAGVSKQLKAFQEGFSRILPVEILRMFSSNELRNFFSATSENQTLRLKKWIENCKLEYFDNDTQVVKFLLEVVSEYDSRKQKLFLQFVTGASRLPMDEHIDWKLRICRSCGKDKNNADELLPSAMTCAKALYLPEYSNKEIMRDKLDYALQEGLNSFQLM